MEQTFVPVVLAVVVVPFPGTVLLLVGAVLTCEEKIFIQP